jgi:hypothetical protein
MLGFYASFVWKKRLHETKRPSKKSFPGFSQGPNFVCEWECQTEVTHARNRTSCTLAQTQIVPRANLCETAFAHISFDDENELKNGRNESRILVRVLMTSSRKKEFSKKFRRVRLSV